MIKTNSIFQAGDSTAPARSEPNTPRHRNENSTEQEKVEDDHEKVEKQEDFADFSRFESFVEAQDGEGRRGSSPRPGVHKRSFSLDHSHVRVFDFDFLAVCLSLVMLDNPNAYTCV